MNYFRRHKSQRRTDRAHSRVKTPKSRRLAIEQIESRVMLSGDGVASLDRDTFNLFEYTVDYAVISNDAAPSTNGAVDFDSTTPVLPYYSSNGGVLIQGNSLSPTGLQDNTIPSESLIAVIHQYRDQLSVGPASIFNRAADSNTFGSLVGSDAISLVTTLNSLREQWKSSLISGDSAFLTIDVLAPSVGGELMSTRIGTTVMPPVVDAARDVLTDVTDNAIALPVATVRPMAEVPTFVVQPIAPPNSIVTIGQSDAQIDVGQIVDELLGSGTNFVDQSLPEGTSTSGADNVKLSDAEGTLQTDGLFDAPATGNAPLVAAAGSVPDEGGMIPIQEIVGELAKEAISAPTDQQIAAADAPAEISGELARVAIMELIAGEADPAAPQSEVDHAFLVATADATFAPGHSAGDESYEQSETLASLRVIAEQAGLAAALMAPANPVYLAALLSTASDAFAAAAMSAPLSAAPAETASADARSEAFSQWDDAAPHGRKIESEDGTSYGLLPLVGVLAMERIVAAKRKQKQNAAAAPPLPVR